MDIIKKLKKRPRIRGVTGIGHWAFIEQAIGKRDGKANQLLNKNGICSTQWIEYKYNCYYSYVNMIYLMAIPDLEKNYVEIHEKYEQICIMEEPCSISDEDSVTTNEEEKERKAARKAAKKLADLEQRRDYLLSLAKIRANLLILDEALLHNLERAEYILKTHIGSYWKGVLKSTDELPIFPCVSEKELKGKEVYEKQLKNANHLLDELLCKEREDMGHVLAQKEN